MHYQCAFKGCPRVARDGVPEASGKRYCGKHGGGKRCEMENCNKVGLVCHSRVENPRTSKPFDYLCIAHGGGRRCAVPGCTRAKQGGKEEDGYRCYVHGGNRLTCKVETCQRLVRKKNGLCKKHKQIAPGRTNGIDHGQYNNKHTSHDAYGHHHQLHYNHHTHPATHENFDQHSPVVGAPPTPGMPPVTMPHNRRRPSVLSLTGHGMMEGASHGFSNFTRGGRLGLPGSPIGAMHHLTDNRGHIHDPFTPGPPLIVGHGSGNGVILGLGSSNGNNDTNPSLPTTRDVAGNHSRKTAEMRQQFGSSSHGTPKQGTASKGVRSPEHHLSSLQHESDDESEAQQPVRVSSLDSQQSIRRANTDPTTFGGSLLSFQQQLLSQSMLYSSMANSGRMSHMGSPQPPAVSQRGQVAPSNVDSVSNAPTSSQQPGTLMNMPNSTINEFQTAGSGQQVSTPPSKTPGLENQNTDNSNTANAQSTPLTRDSEPHHEFLDSRNDDIDALLTTPTAQQQQAVFEQFDALLKAKCSSNVAVGHDHNDIQTTLPSLEQRVKWAISLLTLDRSSPESSTDNLEVPNAIKTFFGNLSDETRLEFEKQVTK